MKLFISIFIGHIFLFIGGVLVIRVFLGGNLQYLLDWSTAKIIGYNIWTIISLLGGSYLIYVGSKKINQILVNHIKKIFKK